MKKFFGILNHSRCAICFFALSLGCVQAMAQVEAPALPTSDMAYQQFGGKAGIRKNVDEFLVLVLADPRIRDYFKETNIKRLADLLTDQFCMLIGGPCKYEGDSMKAAHEGMRLRDADFNALAEDLQEAMARNNVPIAAQFYLLSKLAPMQRDIVKH